MNPPPGSQGTPEKDANGASPSELSVLDLRVLQEMGLVPTEGLGSMAGEIIALFLQEERRRMEGLARLIAERDNLEMARSAHNLAGSSAILGARQVQAASIALELAARQGSWPAILPCWETLRGAWERLETALAQPSGS